jgi:DNA-binding SARP family transcriptional activator
VVSRSTLVRTLETAALELFTDGRADLAIDVLELLAEARPLPAPLAVLYAAALAEMGEDDRALAALKGAEAAAAELRAGEPRARLEALCANARAWMPGGSLSGARRSELKAEAARWQPRAPRREVDTGERGWKL